MIGTFTTNKEIYSILEQDGMNPIRIPRQGDSEIKLYDGNGATYMCVEDSEGRVELYIISEGTRVKEDSSKLAKLVKLNKGVKTTPLCEAN